MSPLATMSPLRFGMCVILRNHTACSSYVTSSSPNSATYTRIKRSMTNSNWRSHLARAMCSLVAMETKCISLIRTSQRMRRSRLTSIRRKGGTWAISDSMGTRRECWEERVGLTPILHPSTSIRKSSTSHGTQRRTWWLSRITTASSCSRVLDAMF